jgi:carboxyl-terminal processing protease
MGFLPPRNSRNGVFVMKRRYLIAFSCFLAFLLVCFGFTVQPNNTAKAVPAEKAFASEPYALVEQVCSQIYHGDFATARELIDPYNTSNNSSLSRLADIISAYETTRNKRQEASKAAYQEQLAELEKLQAPTDGGNDANDFDINDVNDIVEGLAVINKACELADEVQKQELLSNESVKEIFQAAIDKAAEYETEGKWIEAYSNCYVWLKAIDPNNKGYSDYSDQLLDKATIAAALEDNPCETREERFEGVRKDMFERTIIFLELHYVTTIDYNLMADKAIERCKLLAEVAGTTSRFRRDSESEDISSQRSELEEKNPELSELLPGQNSFVPPDKRQIAVWSTSLTTLLNQAKLASGNSGMLNKREFLGLYDQILKLNEITVDLPPQVLIAQFSEAALATLDPYTVIVWPRQVKDFEKMMTNEFTGIGIEISRRKGLLTVASLLPDTPAYRSGLDADDVIEAVDGIKTKDMTLTCAVHKITGPRGTQVTLTIKRPGVEGTRDITITRDKIIVPTIRGWQRTDGGKWLYMIDPENKIGYVRITSFSAGTAPGLEKALDELESDGLQGLIVDLRFNTGGLLDSAVSVVDKFVEEGTIVTRQQGFGRMPIYEYAHKKNTHPDYPLVILVNSNSASASEIVAGALADKAFERATLVGTRTHGKGSVQGITGFPGGRAQLKYTMAHYHLPSNQRVESREAMEKLGRTDWGVGPDVEVELNSDELKKMIEAQRDNDVLVQADHDSNNKTRKHTAEETLAADPQLAIGLLVVRSKLIESEVPALAQRN